MFVISAASGNLGRTVANALKAFVNPSEIRLAARSPDKLSDLKAQGFDVVRADYEDTDSLATAFAGAKAVLIISSMGPNEVRVAHHKAAIDAAKAARVGLLVYTSAANPTSKSKFEWAPAHEQTEAYLKACGLPYVILRDSSYAANIDGFIAQALESGTLALPGAATKVAYVTHEDIAAAAAAALTGKAQANATYELTGPDGVSAFDLADHLSKLAGKPIKAVDLSLPDLSAFLGSVGLPPFVVAGVTSFFAAAAAGEYAAPSKDIEKLTGRAAQSMNDYLKKFA